MNLTKRNLVLMACVFPFFYGCASTKNKVPDVPKDNAVDAFNVKPDIGKDGEKKVYLDTIKRMIETGSYMAAIAHAMAFEKNFGEDDMVSLMKADALLQAGMDDESLSIYQSLRKVKDFEGPALNGIGKYYAKKNQWEVAEGFFKKAVEIQPANPVFLNNMAFAMYRNGKYQEASRCWMMAIDLSPGNKTIINNLAILSREHGEYLSDKDMIILYRKMGKDDQESINGFGASSYTSRSD